jgi:hypothetical protein
MLKASTLGTGFCMTIYMISGIIGYLMYGSLCVTSILPILKSDLILYKGKDTFIITFLVAINIAFMISSTMSIPLMFFTLKTNFINSVIFCSKKSAAVTDQPENISLHSMEEKLQFNQNHNPTEGEVTQSISESKKTIIITLLYISICMITIVIPDLDIVSIILLTRFSMLWELQQLMLFPSLCLTFSC